MILKRIFAAITIAMLAAGSAQAATVMNSSFEDTPGFNKGRNWQVYNSIAGWTTTGGAGIEVQSNATLRGIDAQDGDKYIELDSHGNSSNSQMSQDLTLSKGKYKLSFYYAPRTNDARSNGIDYSIGDMVLGNVSGPNGTYARLKWTKVDAEFRIKETGTYALSFAATGREDSLGGLIDNVSVAAVPLPASALLLLGGLGAMGAMRRRQKS